MRNKNLQTPSKILSVVFSLKNKIRYIRDNKYVVRQEKSTAGFTILFAVIVSTLVLALGLGIVAITMKEVQLSSAGRDSQLAFYAADSGSECALYFDSRGDYFATSSDSGPNQPIICNGKTITAEIIEDPEPTSNTATSTFQMCMSYVDGECDKEKPCVDVVIAKQQELTPPNRITTSVDARGYNTCKETHPRRLERGYRLDY